MAIAGPGFCSQLINRRQLLLCFNEVEEELDDGNPPAFRSQNSRLAYQKLTPPRQRPSRKRWPEALAWARITGGTLGLVTNLATGGKRRPLKKPLNSGSNCLAVAPDPNLDPQAAGKAQRAAHGTNFGPDTSTRLQNCLEGGAALDLKLCPRREGDPTRPRKARELVAH